MSPAGGRFIKISAALLFVLDLCPLLHTDPWRNSLHDFTPTQAIPRGEAPLGFDISTFNTESQR